MEKKKQDGFLRYAKIIMTAKLDLKAKALLWFYANAYGWIKKRPSYYTQEQICAYVGFSPSTYQKTRKTLETLGWIVVSKAKFDLPLFVTPKVGVDDPKYVEHSWSKWHKEFNSSALEDAIENLPPEHRDPFWNDK